VKRRGRAEIQVGRQERVDNITVHQIKSHRQLDCIQSPESARHSEIANQLLGQCPVVGCDEGDMKSSSRKIRVESSPELIQRGFWNDAGPHLQGENGLDFDEGELGDDEMGIRGPGEFLDLHAARFGMVKLRQGAGIDEVPRHLTFVPFAAAVEFEFTPDGRERGTDRLQGHLVVRQRFELGWRCIHRVCLRCGVFENQDTDDLLLPQRQRFDRAQDTALIDGLYASRHTFIVMGAATRLEPGAAGPGLGAEHP
jgi:hypothetical protein